MQILYNSSQALYAKWVLATLVRNIIRSAVHLSEGINTMRCEEQSHCLVDGGGSSIKGSQGEVVFAVLAQVVAVDSGAFIL